MDPFVISCILIGCATLQSKRRYQVGARVVTPTPAAPHEWKNPGAPARIRQLVSRITRVHPWPGLADYLVAVAWTESRGDPNAQHDASYNSARGWFQIRPQTAGHPAILQNPDLLKNEAWAVAAAADLAERLGRKYAAPGQEPDWVAIRRGWAYPRLVADVHETNPRSVDVRRRVERAHDAAGIPRAAMYSRVFPPNFRWPGFEVALRQIQHPQIRELPTTARRTPGPSRTWRPMIVPVRTRVPRLSLT